tara:strand:- start:2291 stop:2695 length:405 start_codon:yes stop_codon:yes gene_type:complete
MAEINTIDRRKETSLHEEQPKITIADRVSIILAGFQLSDVLSTKNHSDDFNDTRAHFILVRLKLMAYFFAILVSITKYVLFADHAGSFFNYCSHVLQKKNITTYFKLSSAFGISITDHFLRVNPIYIVSTNTKC